MTIWLMQLKPGLKTAFTPTTQNSAVIINFFTMRRVKITLLITFSSFFLIEDLGMGQNIARLSTSILLEGPDWVGSAISPWYDEVADVDCNTVSDFT